MSDIFYCLTKYGNIIAIAAMIVAIIAMAIAQYCNRRIAASRFSRKTDSFTDNHVEATK